MATVISHSRQLLLVALLLPMGAALASEPSADLQAPPPQAETTSAVVESVDADAAPPVVVDVMDVDADAVAITATDANAAQDEADADYALIYGDDSGASNSQVPDAEGNLPPPAHISEIWDPWEKTNRRIHRFNKMLDDNLARPAAKTYVKVVPRVVRLGVNNFFSNLRLPVSAVNSLLQGKPGNAGRNVARFAINTTLGLGGVVDAASDANIIARTEDFGQTLGTWGWQRSRYVELPFFGPRTIRDTIGMTLDAPLSPVRHVSDQYTRLGLQGLSLIDVRAQLLSLDALAEGVEDDYTLMRDAWSRRRMYQINSDRRSTEDEQLPDYLQDDSNPQTPADVIPVIQP